MKSTRLTLKGHIYIFKCASVKKRSVNEKKTKMQKFVVKKSKSAPLASTSLSQAVPAMPTMSSEEKAVPLNASTAKLNSTETTTAMCKANVTAKQTTAQSATTPSPTSHVMNTQIKMSGYLKKKRNVRANLPIHIGTSKCNIYI